MTVEASAYKSTHNYSLETFGITKQDIQDELVDVFDHYGFER